MNYLLYWYIFNRVSYCRNWLCWDNRLCFIVIGGYLLRLCIGSIIILDCLCSYRNDPIMIRLCGGNVLRFLLWGPRGCWLWVRVVRGGSCRRGTWRKLGFFLDSRCSGWGEGYFSSFDANGVELLVFYSFLILVVIEGDWP